METEEVAARFAMQQKVRLDCTRRFDVATLQDASILSRQVPFEKHRIGYRPTVNMVKRAALGGANECSAAHSAGQFFTLIFLVESVRCMLQCEAKSYGLLVCGI